MSDTEAEPRPHDVEPLALDLLNTRFKRDGVVCDWLAQDQNRKAFLALHGQDWSEDIEVPYEPLATARDAVAGLVDDDRDDVAALRSQVESILKFGRINAVLDGETMRLELYGAPARWTVPVRALHNAIDLAETHPNRIRSCSHPNCVLWFLDTSRNGKRRWCSMERCGNRAKAQKHYRRKTKSVEDA